MILQCPVQEEGSSVMKIIRGRFHSGFLHRAKAFPNDKILNDDEYRGVIFSLLLNFLKDLVHEMIFIF